MTESEAIYPFLVRLLGHFPNRGLLLMPQFTPGMLINARHRLWRVDSHQGDVLFGSSSMRFAHQLPTHQERF